MTSMSEAIVAAMTAEARTGKLTEAASGYQFAIIMDIWSNVAGPAYDRAKALAEEASATAMTAFVGAYARAAGRLVGEFPGLTLRTRPELPQVTPPLRGQWIREDYPLEFRTLWHRASGDLVTRVTPLVATVHASILCGQKTIELGRSDGHSTGVLTSDAPTGKVCKRCPLTVVIA